MSSQVLLARKLCEFVLYSLDELQHEGEQEQSGVGWIARGDVGKLSSTREMHSASESYAAET